MASFFFAFVFALFAASRLSSADVVASVPFYYASATAVDPQISTLLIGVNQTVGQAVVSGDRKYVTLSMSPSLLGSQGIKTFTYQKSGVGFVGSAGTAGAPAAAAGQFTPSIAATPSEIAPPVSALDKPGMVLIASLER